MRLLRNLETAEIVHYVLTARGVAEKHDFGTGELDFEVGDAEGEFFGIAG